MCFILVFMTEDGAFMSRLAPFGCLPFAWLKFRSVKPHVETVEGDAVSQMAIALNFCLCVSIFE